MNPFDLDSPLINILNKIADLFILNLLFIICCIPILTIGTSQSALYSVTLKSVKGEESHIFKSFFHAFKNNLKISLISWLLVMFIGILLLVDYRIVLLTSIKHNTFFRIILIGIFIFYYITVLYLFPYIARFDDTLSVSIKNSILLAISNLPITLVLLLIQIFAALATFTFDFRITGFIWIILGFSGLSLINSIFFRKIFASIE